MMIRICIKCGWFGYEYNPRVADGHDLEHMICPHCFERTEEVTYDYFMIWTPKDDSAGLYQYPC